MPEENDKEQRIRERAYFLWIEEGKPEGRDKEHWEAARAALEEEEQPRGEHEANEARPPPSPSFGL
jgi:hypothetical protein